MKTNSEKNRSKTSYRKWFILLPVVFLLCGYLLLFASLAPILDPLLSVYRLAFTNANVQTIDEPGAGSVFNGTTGLTQGVLNWDDFEFPAYGEAFGRITVEGTEIDTDVIYGDSTALLKRGACMSLYSHIPGCGTGTLIGAHNNTYFHTLQYVKEGALVHLDTTYGSYVYKVYKTAILENDDAAGYRSELNGDKDILLLYTCYPNDTIASTPYRFFAFCELVSGPRVNMYE